MTKANQCYDGVVEGLSDIGFSVLAYTPGRFPIILAVDLPLGYTSGVVATKVINDVYTQYKPKELDAKKFNGKEIIDFIGTALKKYQ